MSVETKQGGAMTKKEERELRKLQIENEKLKKRLEKHGDIVYEVVHKAVACRFCH